MDKKTEKLLIESEEVAVAAEDFAKASESIDSDGSLADAIKLAFLLNKFDRCLTEKRKDRNEAAQKTIKANTALFQPMMTRVEKARATLRDLILTYLVPTGDLGNMDPEEIRSFGTDGVGVGFEGVASNDLLNHFFSDVDVRRFQETGLNGARATGSGSTDDGRTGSGALSESIVAQ